MRVCLILFFNPGLAAQVEGLVLFFYLSTVRSLIVLQLLVLHQAQNGVTVAEHLRKLRQIHRHQHL